MRLYKSQRSREPEYPEIAARSGWSSIQVYVNTVAVDSSRANVAISVDGLPQGFASYGSGRTDVCTVFPGRVGCPNVGWFSHLDTTKFQNGSHTVSFVVSSSRGDVLTLTRAIQTSNWELGLWLKDASSRGASPAMFVSAGRAGVP
jgi:hypothetical protein